MYCCFEFSLKKTILMMINIMIIIIINVFRIYPGAGPQASAFGGLLLS